MSVKSQMAAMRYLSNMKPKQYELENYMGRIILRERIQVLPEVKKWIVLHSIFLNIKGVSNEQY